MLDSQMFLKDMQFQPLSLSTSVLQLLFCFVLPVHELPHMQGKPLVIHILICELQAACSCQPSSKTGGV